MKIHSTNSNPNSVISPLLQLEGDLSAKQYDLDIMSTRIYNHPAEFFTFLEEIAAVEKCTGKCDSIIHLLCSVLEKARFDHEINRSKGANLLSEAEKLLQGLAEANRLTEFSTGLFAPAYMQAGLQIPNALSEINREKAELLAEVCNYDASIFTMYVQEVLSGLDESIETGFHDFYQQYVKMLSSFVVPTRYLFVKESVRQIHDNYGGLGCMLLLERDEKVRIAALEGLEDRMALGKWTVGIYQQLTIIRNWLGDSDFAARVDRLIDSAIEKDSDQLLKLQVAKIRTVRASIVDSSGTQVLIAFVQHGKNHYVVILTLKQGFGVKTATVQYCESSTPPKQIFSFADPQCPVFDVDPAYFRTAVGIALADGLKNGYSPNSDFLATVEVSGLYDLQPIGSGNANDILETVFTTDGLASLTDAEKSDLLAASWGWEELTNFYTTWQEQSDAITNALQNETGKQKLEEICWEYLEQRREYWATKVAWMAVLVSMMHPKDRCGHEALEFAVVAREIMSGGDLKMLPPMWDVVEHTIEFADYVDNSFMTF